MEDLAIKIATLILDKVGLPGLLGAVFLALYVVELRRHESTRKELVTERAARVDDLKTILPVIQMSTTTSQATATGLASMSEAVKELRDVIRDMTLLRGRS